MSPQEFTEARQNFGLGRREFGYLLGFGGEPKNIWITVKRYETRERDISPTVERLVRMLVWFKADYGYLPDLNSGRREPMTMPEVFQNGEE